MPYIVIINSISFGGGSTQLSEVGDALGAMALKAKTGGVPADAGNTTNFIDLDHAGPMAAEVQKVADAMAVAKIETDGVTWSREATIGSNKGAALKASGLNVRFVFDTEDTMHVVVPYQDTLDFGLYAGNIQMADGSTTPHSPPMAEPEYLKVLPETRTLLDQFFLAVADELNLDMDQDANKDLKEDLVNRFAPDVEGNADERKALFFEQLGAYSVRQCS